jgi:transcriptional regulator with XRE-family HTH domain
MGECIRQERKAGNMLQRELADRVQASKPDVSDWENGVHVPKGQIC